MKRKLCLFGAVVLAVSQVAPFARSQENAATDVEKQLAEQQAAAHNLSIDEQLKLRAAQQKAADDPDVKAALAKRNQAIEEFRQAMHDSMVKSNPALEAILAKIAVGQSPGF